MLSRRDLVRSTLTLGAATAAWVPGLQLAFPAGDLNALARSLAEHHLRLWEDPTLRREEQARMRSRNAEWDFMGRTFLVLGLVNLALRRPPLTDRVLQVVDRILADTLEVEAEHGQGHFLLASSMGLANWFQDPSGRSVFVDGEVALALAARELLRRDGRWDGPLGDRVERIRGQLSRGPVHAAESYPDECWTFCNTAAVAALALDEAVRGTDHQDVIRGFLASAKAHLVDEESGLLVSAFHWDGRPVDGPEGSSIWVASHFLLLVDPPFAADQYARARSHLGRRLLGFGWGREWPDHWRGRVDIDSGPIVPVLDASPGSSGLALLAANAFGDESWLRSLVRSVRFAAFPIRGGSHDVRFAASNQVGDAMMLYALTVGPLWDRANSLREVT